MTIEEQAKGQGTAEGAATPDAGSAAATSQKADTKGAEGSKEPEPTIEVDGEQVPISKVKAGLGALKDFTQATQKLSKREREIAEKELALRGINGVADALLNPEVAAKVVEAVPQLASIMPTRQQLGDDALRAENLKLHFERFAAEHPEYTDDQIVGIGKEMYELAKAGKIDDALDFDTIGLRLYRDDIFARERAKALADATAQVQQQQQAGVVGAGVASIPRPQDISKLTPEQKIALGHANRR